MMKKYIPFAEYNIWSTWNWASVLNRHFCDRFIGRLEQEVTSQIIHRAWYFTYVSYAFGQGRGVRAAAILLHFSLEISRGGSTIPWHPRFVSLAFMKPLI